MCIAVKRIGVDHWVSSSLITSDVFSNINISMTMVISVDPALILSTLGVGLGYYRIIMGLDV